MFPVQTWLGAWLGSGTQPCYEAFGDLQWSLKINWNIDFEKNNWGWYKKKRQKIAWNTSFNKRFYTLKNQIYVSLKEKKVTQLNQSVIERTKTRVYLLIYVLQILQLIETKSPLSCCHVHQT